MRAETDPRGGLGRDAMGPPRSRSLNLDDPGGSLGLPRPVHPAGPEESAHDALPTRSLDGAHPRAAHRLHKPCCCSLCRKKRRNNEVHKSGQITCY